jgi:hypothetical protein
MMRLAYTQAARLASIRREPQLKMIHEEDKGRPTIVSKGGRCPVRYKGITTDLGALYHSNVRMCTPKKRTVASRAAEQKEEAHSDLAGKERGTQVDREVGMIVARIQQTGETLSDLLKIAKEDAQLRSMQYRTLHIIYLLNENRWHPIVSQVPVSCTTSKRATFIDLLCWDLKYQRYIVIELKTGYTGDYYAGRNQLNAPFGAFTDSWYHRHLLQLILTIRLFTHTYELPPEQAAKVAGMIIRADAEEVVQYPIDEKFMAVAVPELDDVFLSAGTFTKRMNDKTGVTAARAEQKRVKAATKRKETAKRKGATVPIDSASAKRAKKRSAK